MKVVSFTGTFYAKRTEEHSSLFPNKNILEEFMSFDDIDTKNDIVDFRLNDKELALTCKDSANGKIANFLIKHKLPFISLPEIKPIHSMNIDLFRKIL